MWNYLFFIVYLRQKDRTEFTGPESYVWHLLQKGSTDWFPRLRTLSIDPDGSDSDQADQQRVRHQIAETNAMVLELRRQLATIRSDALEQRRQNFLLRLRKPGDVPPSFQQLYMERSGSKFF